MANQEELGGKHGDPTELNPKDILQNSRMASAVQAQVERKLKPAVKQTGGMGALDQIDQDKMLSDKYTWGESAGAAFWNNGIVTGALKAVDNFGDLRMHNEEDPDYNFEAHYNSDEPDLKKRIDAALSGPFADEAFDAFADSKSAQDTIWMLDQFEKKTQDAEIARANGWTAEWTGLLGGLGLDLIPMIFAGGLGGGMRLGTAMSDMAAAVRSKGLVKTVTAYRGQGALRLGAYGLAEGVAEAATQRLTNPTIRDEDVAFGGLLGLGMGAAIGGLFPRIAGMRLERTIEDGALSQADELLKRSDIQRDAADFAANRDVSLGQNSIDDVAGEGVQDIGDEMTASVNTLENQAKLSGMTDEEINVVRSCFT